MMGYLIVAATTVTLWRLMTCRTGCIRVGRVKASWSK